MKNNGKQSFKEKVVYFFTDTMRRNWGMRLLALACGVMAVLLIGFAAR